MNQWIYLQLLYTMLCDAEGEDFAVGEPFINTLAGRMRELKEEIGKLHPDIPVGPNAELFDRILDKDLRPLYLDGLG